VQFINFSSGTGLSSSSYQWNFGDPTSSNNTSSSEAPLHIYENAGLYNVLLTATTIYGCVDTVSHVIVIEEDFALYIPNAFTPNNDRTNDIFLPDGIGISEFQMTIFNRWGNVVYSTSEITKGWDGKSNSGEMVQQDVYIYKIEVTNFKKDKKQFAGQVSLIR
jgi:gliding motility-associated-like protein